MELEQESVGSQSRLEWLKNVMVSAGDFLPVFGSVKMAIEAVMGETAAGFKLNVLERVCYGTAVGFNLGVLYTISPFSEEEDLLQKVAISSACMAGSGVAAFTGKWRHTGSLLYANAGFDRAMLSLKNAAREFILQE